MSQKIIARDYILNRSYIMLALKSYVSSGTSVKKPVHCADLSGSAVENGFRWKTELGDKIEVAVNVKDSSDAQAVREKCKENKVSVAETKQHIFIENTEFNFIYIECTTEASTYFDSVFRNLPRNGIFAISTWDDPALFAHPCEPALRKYSGRIARTFYAPELAVRLILSEMVRSAARYGKAIQVLFSTVFKSSISIIVSIKKSSSHAVDCLHKVRNLIHCINCEERVFLPTDNGYIPDSPVNFLKCGCKYKGEYLNLLLGPLWCGPLASIGFIQCMLDHVTNESVLVKTILHQIMEEARCDSLKTKNIRTVFTSKQSINTESKQSNDETKIEVDMVDEDCKKRKYENNDSQSGLTQNENCLNGWSDQSSYKRLRLFENFEKEFEPAPVFYYNLHKHSPKGPHLEKISKVIEILQQNGFRASRTHFDPGAVKTDANISQLQSLLSISN